MLVKCLTLDITGPYGLDGSRKRGRIGGPEPGMGEGVLMSRLHLPTACDWPLHFPTNFDIA
jgi:hypothetical protein